MGRKLNVALLLTIHVAFFACAGLIVGPLMGDSADRFDQGGDHIAANQSTSIEQVTDLGTQENAREGQLQQELPYQQPWLRQTPNQQRNQPFHAGRWSDVGNVTP